jgi:hypothetical protein
MLFIIRGDNKNKERIKLDFCVYVRAKLNYELDEEFFMLCDREIFLKRHKSSTKIFL